MGPFRRQLRAYLIGYAATFTCLYAYWSWLEGACEGMQYGNPWPFCLYMAALGGQAGLIVWLVTHTDWRKGGQLAAALVRRLWGKVPG